MPRAAAQPLPWTAGHTLELLSVLWARGACKSGGAKPGDPEQARSNCVDRLSLNWTSGRGKQLCKSRDLPVTGLETRGSQAGPEVVFCLLSSSILPPDVAPVMRHVLYSHSPEQGRDEKGCLERWVTGQARTVSVKTPVIATSCDLRLTPLHITK